MTTSPIPPTETTATSMRRGLRRLRPQLSDTHPIRRIGQIAEYFPVLFGIAFMWLWQQLGNPTSGESTIAVLIIMLYLAFLLHLQRENRERIAQYDREEAE